MDFLDKIEQAKEVLKEVALHTPLQKNENLSQKLGAEVWLKREDLQVVRSYKLRGAYTKIYQLSEAERKRGVVCASAGNHAQGVAYACYKLGVKGVIFMPESTPDQKIQKVKLFGKGLVKIVLVGDHFDEASQKAQEYCLKNQAVFVHPFDDEEVIAGQGTVGLEILEDSKKPLDYLFVPIGGGGLASGVGLAFEQLSPQTKIIGVEPAGASSMKDALSKNKNTGLQNIDTFVDGAAVKKVGNRNFEICKRVLTDCISVPEGKVCSTILKLYNEEAIVVEPAGALTIAALDLYQEQIKGKNVACVVSGSNNDITRTEEIRERSLLYEGLKHYFMVNFPQRPGALRNFVNAVLGPRDDITYFQFSKKNNREKGPAVIGIELHNPADFSGLENRLKENHFHYQYLNPHSDLFTHLIF